MGGGRMSGRLIDVRVSQEELPFSPITIVLGNRRAAQAFFDLIDYLDGVVDVDISGDQRSLVTHLATARDTSISI
jgi:hypothetical protein